MRNETLAHMIKRLICFKCGKQSEPLINNPYAWDGWMIVEDANGVEHDVCPECAEK